MIRLLTNLYNHILAGITYRQRRQRSLTSLVCPESTKVLVVSSKNLIEWSWNSDPPQPIKICSDGINSVMDLMCGTHIMHYLYIITMEIICNHGWCLWNEFIDFLFSKSMLVICSAVVIRCSRFSRVTGSNLDQLRQWENDSLANHVRSSLRNNHPAI